MNNPYIRQAANLLDSNWQASQNGEPVSGPLVQLGLGYAVLAAAKEIHGVAAEIDYVRRLLDRRLSH